MWKRGCKYRKRKKGMRKDYKYEEIRNSQNIAEEDIGLLNKLW